MHLLFSSGQLEERGIWGSCVLWKRGVSTGEFTVFQVIFDIVLTPDRRYAGPSSDIMFAARNTLEDRCGMQTVAKENVCLPSHHHISPAAPPDPECV